MLSPGVLLELTWAMLAEVPLFYGRYIDPPKRSLLLNISTEYYLEKEVIIINDMVSRGEIPDPKTYKGSVLMGWEK
jgi:hypothetical protein